MKKITHYSLATKIVADADPLARYESLKQEVKSPARHDQVGFAGIVLLCVSQTLNHNTPGPREQLLRALQAAAKSDFDEGGD